MIQLLKILNPIKTSSYYNVIRVVQSLVELYLINFLYVIIYQRYQYLKQPITLSVTIFIQFVIFNLSDQDQLKIFVASLNIHSEKYILTLIQKILYFAFLHYSDQFFAPNKNLFLHLKISSVFEEKQINNIHVIRSSKPDEIAAQFFIDQIKSKQDSILGLATGSTPEKLYQILIKSKLDLSRVKTFNLDEYKDIKRSNQNSYYSFMHDRLFNHVNVKEQNIHIINCEASNIEQELQNYEKMISENPIDIQLLGIGTDGHIAFNEPGSSKESKTRVVQLTEQTIRDNSRFFSKNEFQPTEALTMGISTIMKAKKIVLVAKGSNKQDAITKMLYGKESSDCPASFLRDHSNVIVVVDENIKLPQSSPNFVELEHQTLDFWKQNNVFQKQLDLNKDKEKYVFLEGPVFCQSTMHYGHMLAGSIKDSITRYYACNGYNVPRKLGYDTHGLPIEYEADKQLGIKASNQIVSEEKLQQLKEKGIDTSDMMTIDKYNEFCENLVNSTAQKWNNTIERIARWIDMEHDYKTMYPTFMESSWWVFKQLWEKNLVYQGVKVMPFSWKLSCSLSNFEAGQNYKDVVDPCVVVKFKLVNQPSSEKTRYILAWTTTPWTLPSNLALCVNKAMKYSVVSLIDHPEEEFIVADDRLAGVFLSGKNKDLKKVINVIDHLTGEQIVGTQYEPLFPYFANYKQEHPKAFTVLCDDYVTSSDGTGIVHQAPYFGEDDYRVCLANEVINSNQKEIVCPVDDCGCFDERIVDFKGLQVKEADKLIIQHLKQTKQLFSQATVKHSYPYCYRSDTPLIYKAVPSWFINVTELKEKMLNNHKETNWVPETFKAGRMGNWIAQARDWAVSRNRFWGCPIPVWESADGTIRKCIGSLDELRELAGEKSLEDAGIFADLSQPHDIHHANIHRQFVDRVKIPDPRGPEYPPLRRIEPVFDCWFESGSMPYGQIHYPWCDLPGTSKEDIHFKFQQNDVRTIADFIAEGQDQQRGWFYVLLVLSTALFDVAPSQNTIVNGLILAKDGQKMSKRLRNYPDPTQVIETYGADAIRLYLINSPSVRAMEMKFNEEGVKDVVKDVFIPLYNVNRLFFQSLLRRDQNMNVADLKLTAEISELPELTNIFDQYIISEFIELTNSIHQEMQKYHLYTVLPKLLNFLNDFTNCYIRLSKDRLKAGDQSIQVLYYILINFCTLLCPYCPYISDYIYRQLAALSMHEMPISVHLKLMVKFTEEQTKQNINQYSLDSISALKQIILLGRQCRLTQCKISSLKTPLKAVKIICENQATLDQLQQLESCILQELNVLSISYDKDINSHCKLQLYPLINDIKSKITDRSVVGKVVAAAMKLSKTYTIEDVKKLQNNEAIGDLLPEYFQIQLNAVNPNSAASGVFCLEFDVTSDLEVIKKQINRELMSKINRNRKDMKLGLADVKDVKILYQKCETESKNKVTEKDVEQVIEEIKQNVKGTITLEEQQFEDGDLEVDGMNFKVVM